MLRGLGACACAPAFQHDRPPDHHAALAAARHGDGATSIGATTIPMPANRVQARARRSLRCSAGSAAADGTRSTCPNTSSRVRWGRAGQPFIDNKVSRRAHVWTFDGGIEVPASSSPSGRAACPYSGIACGRPRGGVRRVARELPHALVSVDRRGSASSASTATHDDARGVMGRNAAGKLAMTRVDAAAESRVRRRPSCRPAEEIACDAPRGAASASSRNSVTTEVRCEPIAATSGEPGADAQHRLQE